MPGSRSIAPWTAGVFAFCLLVYGVTLSPTVPGGDAGELLVVAESLGVAHPPGYPLWTLLAWLFTLVPAGSVAWRVAWLSAACSAAAAALVFACVGSFVRTREPEVATAPAIAGAAVAAGLFAFSPTVWAYAVGAEVFPLNSLFAALLFFLALRWDRTREPRDAYAIALAAGLGLSNHHALVFFVLPVASWLLWTGRRALLTPARLGRLALAGAAGLLPYAYLGLAGRAENPASWGDTATMSGLLDHLLRRDYGTFQLLPAGHAASSPWFAKVAAYGAHFARASLAVGAACALCTAGPAAKPRNSWILLLLASALFYVGVFHALANVAVGDAFLLGVLARFWMQADLVLCILAGIGFAAVCSRLPPSARRASWWSAAGLVVLQLGLGGGERADRGGAVVESYGRAILEPLPPRALLLTQGDLITNVVRYLQSCEDLRDDVVVLDQELMTKPWYVRRMARRFPQLRFPGARYHPGAADGFSMREFLDANAGGRAVFVYPEWKAGDASTDGAWRLWPEGLASRALPEDASPDVSKWAVASAVALGTVDARGWPPLGRHPVGTWERVALEDVWQARHRRAVFLLREAIARGGDEGLLTIARGELEAAERLHPDPPWHLFLNLGIVYERLAARSPHLRHDQLAAWKRYLATAPADEPARSAVADAVARMEESRHRTPPAPAGR